MCLAVLGRIYWASLENSDVSSFSQWLHNSLRNNCLALISSAFIYREYLDTILKFSSALKTVVTANHLQEVVFKKLITCILSGISYEDALKDGVILCMLMNRLQPGLVSKVNTSGGDYKMMDNLNQ